MRDEPAIILDDNAQESLLHRAGRFWGGLKPANRVAIGVVLAIVIIVKLSHSSSVPVSKADEQAIHARFPTCRSIILYHDRGNVPEPRGVDWSKAREYRVRDNTQWGRWSVVIMDGQVIDVTWVDD